MNYLSGVSMSHIFEVLSSSCVNETFYTDVFSGEVTWIPQNPPFNTRNSHWDFNVNASLPLDVYYCISNFL